MALIKHAEIAQDPWTDASGLDAIPATGPVIVSLEQWEAQRETLVGRADPVGVRLRSDEPPARIADDLDRLALVALEFPAFKDGRAYSYARLLRERHGFRGELRAVGDVLCEQLHYMERCGFDAFEIASGNALDEWRTASTEMGAWYQRTGDGRKTAIQLRHE
ncbi:MAG: DUF934 domain-containing protein [Deltaproteobacteria bacterium]|nr:DUF934 domain-containing protein [Deltaproteobacteria bacterium]MBW2419637.1 DUF934 domain-containing protein [Deltaproteobacteria bacterium]